MPLASHSFPRFSRKGFIMKITVEKHLEYKPNIFFMGNLVCCKDDEDFVILVTGPDNSDEQAFSGVRITEWNKMPFGEHAKGWDKNQFKQFYGKITLEL